jgi:dihydrofolate reductase
MRKLKLQMQTSVNGFMAGPNGEMDWMTWDWDQALKDHVTALHADVDCMLLGRKLAEGFIPVWADRLKEGDPGAALFVDTPKVVFSRTLKECPWGDNTTLATGDLAEEVSRLKAADGGALMAYGGGEFVSELIKHNLIDEYHFFVNPAGVTEGMTVFREPGAKKRMKLLETKPFECGIVVLTYAPGE